MAHEASGPRPPGLQALTPAQRRVFHLIGQGQTSKEIASALRISVWTVANHRKTLCQKLGLHTTAELVTYAARVITDPAKGAPTK